MSPPSVSTLMVGGTKGIMLLSFKNGNTVIKISMNVLEVAVKLFYLELFFLGNSSCSFIQSNHFKNYLSSALFDSPALTGQPDHNS